MRYLTGLVFAGVVGAAASLYTPSAKAAVVVSVGLPLPVIVSPIPSYPRHGYYPFARWPYLVYRGHVFYHHDRFRRYPR